MNTEPESERYFKHGTTGQIVSLSRQIHRRVQAEAVGRELHGRQKRRFLKALRRAERAE